MSEPRWTPDPWQGALELRQVQRGLFLIKVSHVDHESRFHRELVRGLAWCEETATDGELLSSVRFVAGQEKHRALNELAEARRALGVMLRTESRKVREGDKKMSVAASERIVQESEAYWALKFAGEIAEATVTACTDLMFALQAAADAWRTNRADDRAGDSEHSRPWR